LSSIRLAASTIEVPGLTVTTFLVMI